MSDVTSYIDGFLQQVLIPLEGEPLNLTQAQLRSIPTSQRWENAYLKAEHLTDPHSLIGQPRVEYDDAVAYGATVQYADVDAIPVFGGGTIQSEEQWNVAMNIASRHEDYIPAVPWLSGQFRDYVNSTPPAFDLGTVRVTSESVIVPQEEVWSYQMVCTLILET